MKPPINKKELIYQQNALLSLIPCTPVPSHPPRPTRSTNDSGKGIRYLASLTMRELIAYFQNGLK